MNYTGTVADLAHGSAEADALSVETPSGGPVMETLHCTAHDGPFTRERKRGVKPSVCPACKSAASTERVAAIVATVKVADPEFVALYMGGEWNLRDRRVAEAFVIADVEPPRQSVIDARGFTAAERKILDAVAQCDAVEDFEVTL